MNLTVVESCNSTWIFDARQLRFCRILKGIEVGRRRVSTEWRPYWELDLSPRTEAFTVYLNEGQPASSVRPGAPRGDPVRQPDTLELSPRTSTGRRPARHHPGSEGPPESLPPPSGGAAAQLRERGRRSLAQAGPDRRRTLLGRQGRGVDLEVVDPGVMDGALPAEHGIGDRSVRPAPEVAALSTGLDGVASAHDRLDRAANADEVRREPGEPPRNLSENSQGPRVLVVVADVDDDAQPQPAEGHHRFVESLEEQGQLWFEVRPFAARTQADPGQQRGRG